MLLRKADSAQVILAFLVTAYATLFFTICAYWGGLVPDELLNAVDKKIFKARSERRPGWSEAFREGIRAFSDQQIVTGIAVLASAFATVNTISVYHWRTVVYLGWMSSNVHLTTLTVLRRVLQSNSAARTLRLTGMMVLLILLVMALVPTSSNNFSAAISNTAYLGYWYSTDPAFNPADPAFCFWQHRYMDGVSKDSILSFIMLAGSYSWKVMSLFGSTHRVAKQVLRDKPAQTVPHLIKKAAVWRNSQHRLVYCVTAWPYSLLVGLYVSYIAVFDFFDSFASSMAILTVSLVWGTLNLMIPRQNLAQYFDSDENEWNFGQYLPVLLLLLPVMSVVEEFSGKPLLSFPSSAASRQLNPPPVRKGKAEPAPPHPRFPAAAASSGADDTFGLLAQRTWTSAPPSRAETHASSSASTPRPHPDAFDASLPSSSSSMHVRNRSREIAIRDLGRPPTGKPHPCVITRVATAESSRGAAGAELWQDEGLYATRFFRSIVWLTLACVFMAASWVFFIQVLSLVNGFSSWRISENVGWAMLAAMGIMFTWAAFGAMCSRLTKTRP